MNMQPSALRPIDPHLTRPNGAGPDSRPTSDRGSSASAMTIRMACVVIACLTGPVASAQQADSGCGNPFVNRFGPFDYRTETGPNRKIVEEYHFSPMVESLIRGQTSSVGGDIDYTLRAFPNHHRALTSMMNLGVKLKTASPRGATVPVECYFKRALVFRPDDTIARMLYAKYLTDSKRPSEALHELDVARDSAKDNGFTHYNIGLLYLELQEFDKALAQSHKALSLGFERPELKTRLQAANKWTEPAAEEPATAVESEAPASEPAH